jgi:hypothetical protein
MDLNSSPAHVSEPLCFYIVLKRVRNAIVSSRHVRLTAWNDPHCPDFDEILYSGFHRKSVEKIQVSLKSDKNMATLHEDVFTFMTISR